MTQKLCVRKIIMDVPGVWGGASESSVNPRANSYAVIMEVGALAQIILYELCLHINISYTSK
jgi:hypothetical protein